MVGYLSPELVTLILLRLPLKSVTSFRLACKSWLSLISSTHFTLMYLRRNFSRTLVCRVSKDKEVYSIHFNDQYFTLDTRCSIEFPVNLHHGGINKFRTVGCCNGVICLSEHESGRDETILWNPYIKKTLTLIPPITRINDSERLCLVFGFGYDKMTDDYKVVRLAYKRISFTRPNVEVYTVKTAIWREVEFPLDLTCFFPFFHWIHVPVFVNGSAHWISFAQKRATESSILAFDMSRERFEEIQLPQNLAVKSLARLSLVVVGESLGVISRTTCSSYEIWVMKEYRNPASWTMLYSKHFPDIDIWRVLGLTNNATLITVSTQGDLKIHKKDGCYNVFDSISEASVLESIFVERYQESLGLLDVGDDVNVRVQELDD